MKLERIALIFCLVFSGCLMPDLLARKVKIDNYYTVPSFYSIDIRDVAFVPFSSQVTLTREQAEKINDIFVTELRKRNWYRVHVMSRKEAEEFTRLERMDAIIEGEILSYKEMEPLKFGLQVSMKYLNTGQTLWSASNIFDATAKDVVQAVKNYYREEKDSASSLWGHEAYLISIGKYVEFCSDMLIDTIERGWQEQVRRVRKEAVEEKRIITESGGQK